MSNGNGLIGDFERFAPRRMSVEDIVEWSKDVYARPVDRRDDTEIVARTDAHDVVRYRLASPSIRMDLAEMGSPDNPFAVSSDAPHLRAVFGLVDRETNRCAAMITAHDRHMSDPASIADVTVHAKHPPSSDELLRALNLVDVPATWRTGAEGSLSRDHGLWFDEDASGWVVREPRMLVRVRMERHCFSTHPILTESIDVFLLPDDDHPLDGDPDVAYWARDHYSNLAHERVQDLQPSIRPGFSSWMSKDDPLLVKVVGTALDAEIEALTQEAGNAEAPAP